MENNVKELIERVKNTANAVIEATGRAAAAAGKKAGEFAQSTKLSIDLFKINSEIDAEYREIGRMVYEAHKGYDVPGEEIDRRLEGIDQKNDKIEQLRAEAEKQGQKQAQTQPQTPVQTSDAADFKQCGGCGKICAASDAYCNACGQKL